jgi:hypothetical protein
MALTSRAIHIIPIFFMLFPITFLLAVLFHAFPDVRGNRPILASCGIPFCLADDTNTNKAGRREERRVSGCCGLSLEMENRRRDGPTPRLECGLDWLYQLNIEKNSGRQIDHYFWKENYYRGSTEIIE